MSANEKPRKKPVPIRLAPSSAGIIVQVQKVSADVSELQKNMAIESAATNVYGKVED